MFQNWDTSPPVNNSSFWRSNNINVTTSTISITSHEALKPANVVLNMPTLQGVTMQIECGGKPLEEYSLLVENDNIATCWIPTEAGKNFQIAWQVDKNPSLGSKHGSIHCYIDGRKVIQDSYGPRDRHDYIDGLRSGPTSMRPFQFSALRVTDHEISRLLDQSNFKQIGVISIEIFRLSDKSYKVTRKRAPSDSSDESFPDDDCVVHETCKKFGLHYVSLGESQFMRYRRPGASVTQRDYLDSTPSLTFNFRYMSAGLLQAKGIVPASMKLCRASYRRDIKCEWEQEQETTRWQSTTTNDLKAGQANKKHGGFPRQTRTNANRRYIYLTEWTGKYERTSQIARATTSGCKGKRQYQTGNVAGSASFFTWRNHRLDLKVHYYIPSPLCIRLVTILPCIDVWVMDRFAECVVMFWLIVDALCKDCTLFIVVIIPAAESS